jgi:5-formyltetrahydrofolate cyclo-ligase
MGESEPKLELRRVVRQSRTARPSSHISEAATTFTGHLTAVAADSSWCRIAAFLPTATEPPITGFLTEFIARGGWCAVPESGPDGLLLWHALHKDFERDLTTDSLGMPIPSTQNTVSLDGLDAVLVPAAAVDRHGNRLGWGKGYYDRFLASIDASTLAVAVVFDSDVVDDVPTESHDRAVDLIVTEVDIYRVHA